MLAALTSARLQAENASEERNVRNVTGPAVIKNMAKNEGWVLKKEEIFVPPKGLQDGRWEVGSILSEDFETEVQDITKRHEGLGRVLEAMKEAVIGALEVVERGLEGVETMSVWVGKLDKGSES